MSGWLLGRQRWWLAQQLLRSCQRWWWESELLLLGGLLQRLSHLGWV
jgi:hypothetical protein